MDYRNTKMRADVTTLIHTHASRDDPSQPLARRWSPEGRTPMQEGIDVAKRLAACWNAFRGWSLEDIERLGTVPRPVSDLHKPTGGGTG